MVYRPLPEAFFARETLTVARELLGHVLVCRGSEGVLACRIVETEAYTQEDPACHAYQRRTGRAATLYKAPGLAYVYLIYGMYHCLNVVTEPEGVAGAVLFRAVEMPDAPAGQKPSYPTQGPGRLTRALGITRQDHNEIPLTDPASPCYLAEGTPVEDAQVVQGPRIGIRQGVDFPWRFYLQGNPWVSHPR